MLSRPVAALLAVSLVAVPVAPSGARADNQMGYQLLSGQEASALTKGGGRLGLNVGKSQHITSGDITFELLKVNSVAPGSPAAQVGFQPGDQVIAVDGKVFPTVAAFGAYVGSKPPGGSLAIDYMPARGGPEDAKRVNVRLGDGYVRGAAGDREARPQRDAGDQRESDSSGWTTGQKIAIGVGAAALFGCYKMGCFSHKGRTSVGR